MKNTPFSINPPPGSIFQSPSLSNAQANPIPLMRVVVFSRGNPSFLFPRTSEGSHLGKTRDMVAKETLIKEPLGKT